MDQAAFEVVNSRDARPFPFAARSFVLVDGLCLLEESSGIDQHLCFVKEYVVS